VLRNCFTPFLVFFLAVGLGGCGKKEAPAPSQTAQPGQTEQAPDPQVATPSAPAPEAATPSPRTYEATVTVRSIDYLKGQATRKNWPQVRLALKQIEGKSLTPEQRQYVDSIKAQIPPGQ